MQEDDLKSRAEARLDSALAERGYADPRGPYRERLRLLRVRNVTLFERATRRFQEWVRASAGGADPLEGWIDYGRFMAELTGTGRVIAVDGTGRASPYEGNARAELILFMPDDASEAVLPLAQPMDPTPAQRAAYDLLVARRQSLRAG